jgi:hypothetical protein
MFIIAAVLFLFSLIRSFSFFDLWVFTSVGGVRSGQSIKVGGGRLLSLRCVPEQVCRCSVRLRKPRRRTKGKRNNNVFLTLKKRGSENNKKEEEAQCGRRKKSNDDAQRRLSFASVSRRRRRLQSAFIRPPLLPSAF